MLLHELQADLGRRKTPSKGKGVRSPQGRSPGRRGQKAQQPHRTPHPLSLTLQNLYAWLLMHSKAKILDVCCKASPPMLWLSLLQGSIGFAQVQ